MKERVEHRHIKALFWSRPQEIAGRRRKYAGTSDKVEKLWKAHEQAFKDAGFIRGPGDSKTRLWWWTMGGEFKLPVFPKKESKLKADAPIQGDMFLESFGEINALKMELRTARDNFSLIQKQFDEMQRLYLALKAKE